MHTKGAPRHLPRRVPVPRWGGPTWEAAARRDPKEQQQQRRQQQRGSEPRPHGAVCSAGSAAPRACRGRRRRTTATAAPQAGAGRAAKLLLSPRSPSLRPARGLPPPPPRLPRSPLPRCRRRVGSGLTPGPRAGAGPSKPDSPHSVLPLRALQPQHTPVAQPPPRPRGPKSFVQKSRASHTQKEEHPGGSWAAHCGPLLMATFAGFTLTTTPQVPYCSSRFILETCSVHRYRLRGV